jgi:hypothetical protein
VELKFYGDDVTSWTDEDTGETYVELSLKEAENLAHQLENVVYPLDDVRDEEAEKSTAPTVKEDEENKEVARRMMENDIHEELRQLVVDLKDEVDRVYDLVLELQEL